MTPEETQRRVTNLESQVQSLTGQVNSLQARPTGVPTPQQSTVTNLGTLPNTLKNILNLGFEWVANKVNVKAADGIVVTTKGVGVKVKGNSGLTLDASGLAVLLEANKGLSMGASGLSTLLKAKGGVIVGTAGLYLDLLLGVVTALTPGAIVAVDFSLGCAFTLIPGEDETLNASNGILGQRATLVITTSGTTPRILTFGTNFKSQGTLSTGAVNGKVFVITFYTLDGTTWYEETRTGAI